MKPTDIVNAYLTAYTAGDVARAASLVTEDFSFQGPMQATEGRHALRAIVAHLAASARGHRVVRQWHDGDEVCTLYQFNIETDDEPTSLLVSEWNTVCDGRVASSLMVFDASRFRRDRHAAATGADPVRGTTIDDTSSPAPPGAALIRQPGEGERFQRDNRTVTIKVDLPEISIHEIEFDPTFEVPPHTHDHVDAMLVLDGEVELLGEMDGQRVGHGTIVAAPAGTQHGFRNPGPGLARLLILHAPDGGFAAMVRAT